MILWALIAESASPLVLSEAQRMALEGLSRSRTGAATVTMRARMMLQCAEGLSNRQIA